MRNADGPPQVESDLAGERLFISDSSQHRIVVTNLQGQFLFQVWHQEAAALTTLPVQLRSGAQ